MLHISSGEYLMTWIQHIRPSSTPDTLTMNDLLGYLSLNNPNYTYLYFEATQTLVSRQQTSSVTWYQGISIFECDLGLPWNGRCVECRRSLDLSHTCTTTVRLRLFIKDFLEICAIYQTQGQNGWILAVFFLTVVWTEKKLYVRTKTHALETEQRQLSSAFSLSH